MFDSTAKCHDSTITRDRDARRSLSSNSEASSHSSRTSLMSSANAHRSLSSSSDASSHSSRTSPMSSASNQGPSSSIDTNSGAVQCFIKAYQPAALCIIMPVDEGDNVFCIDNTSLFLSLVGNEILDILYVHVYTFRFTPGNPEASASF